MPVAPLKKLNGRHKRFAREYLIDLNGAGAARRAGFSVKTADVIAGHLLRDPIVQEEIKRLQDELQEELHISPAQVIARYAQLAFTNIGNYLEWTGTTLRLRPDADLDMYQMAAIAQVKIRDTLYGTTVDLKLHDSVRALDRIAEHLGIHRPKDVHLTQVNIFPAQEELEEQLYDDLDRLAGRLTGDDEPGRALSSVAPGTAHGEAIDVKPEGA